MDYYIASPALSHGNSLFRTYVIEIDMGTFIPNFTYRNKNPIHQRVPWFSKACDQFQLSKIHAHRNFFNKPTPENRQLLINLLKMFIKISVKEKLIDQQIYLLNLYKSVSKTVSKVITISKPKILSKLYMQDYKTTLPNLLYYEAFRAWLA